MVCRTFSKGWCKVLVYTFENQPFEKMICMAKMSVPILNLLDIETPIRHGFI